MVWDPVAAEEVVTAIRIPPSAGGRPNLHLLK